MEIDSDKTRQVWRKTWPDAENDFTGWDGNVRFARIFSHTTGAWRWLGNHLENIPQQGEEETFLLAALAAEQWWDGVKG